MWKQPTSINSDAPGVALLEIQQLHIDEESRIIYSPDFKMLFCAIYVSKYEYT